MKKLIISMILLLTINCGSELDPNAEADKKKEEEQKAKTQGLLYALYCESAFGYNKNRSATDSNYYSGCIGNASLIYSGLK